VSWNKEKLSWCAEISYKGKNFHLGYFALEDEAARAYDKAARDVYQQPILNFLENGVLNPARYTNLGCASLSTLK
jgi:hypothetical protein